MPTSPEPGGVPPRTDTLGSPAVGKSAAPDDSDFARMRINVPPMHSTPSPNTTPKGSSTSPFKKMQLPVAFIPVPCSTTESVVAVCVPVRSRCAPAALNELAQPLPTAPKFAHGHAVVTMGSTPSPEQYGNEH